MSRQGGFPVQVSGSASIGRPALRVGQSPRLNFDCLLVCICDASSEYSGGLPGRIDSGVLSCGIESACESRTDRDVVLNQELPQMLGAINSSLRCGTSPNYSHSDTSKQTSPWRKRTALDRG